MSALIILFAVFGFLALLAFTYIAGFAHCAWDAEQRLKGKMPVDNYWRSKGMKDPRP